jgi:hypothetical protein
MCAIWARSAMVTRTEAASPKQQASACPAAHSGAVKSGEVFK